MKDFEKKIKFFASKIRLSEDEQRNIKDDLMRQIFARSSVSTYKPAVSLFSIWMRFVPTALMVVFLLGGSVSYAAKDTLPGDLLYPFKLGVTEKVQGMLLVSTKEQAKFEIILVERRAEEAIKLAQTGKLDEKASASITESIDKHTESINLKVEELKVEDKLAAKEVASTMEVSLAEQSEKIAKVAVETNDASAKMAATMITTTTEPGVEVVDIAPLAVKIQEISKDAGEQKTVLEAEILLDPKSPDLTEIDEEKIEEVIDINVSDEPFVEDFENPESISTIDILKTEIKGTATENLENTEVVVPSVEVSAERESKIEVN